MQTLTHIPLADIGEVLKGLAPIIFVVLYGVAHLVGNIQQERRKAAAPPPRPVLPPQEPIGGAARGAAHANPAAGNQPTLEETLRREVEEFLRRAQGQQPQQPKRPQRAGASPPPAPQRPTRPTARGPVRQPDRTPEQREQPTRRLVESQRPEPVAPPTESRPATPLGSSVAAHAQTVAAHVQTVAQHAESLGADIAQTDERMQEHLRQKFVHQVGAIAPTTSVQRQATGSPAAADLRALLARPGGARQLIIASEILRRPEERWGD